MSGLLLTHPLAVVPCNRPMPQGRWASSTLFAVYQADMQSCSLQFHGHIGELPLPNIANSGFSSMLVQRYHHNANPHYDKNKKNTCPGCFSTTFSIMSM